MGASGLLGGRPNWAKHPASRSSAARTTSCNGPHLSSEDSLFTIECSFLQDQGANSKKASQALLWPHGKMQVHLSHRNMQAFAVSPEQSGELCKKQKILMLCSQLEKPAGSVRCLCFKYFSSNISARSRFDFQKLSQLSPIWSHNDVNDPNGCIQAHLGENYFWCCAPQSNECFDRSTWLGFPQCAQQGHLASTGQGLHPGANLLWGRKKKWDTMPQGEKHQEEPQNVQHSDLST